MSKLGNGLRAALYRVVIWYMGRVYHAVGGENRPVFMDVATTAPALLLLENNYQAIRNEVAAILRSNTQLPSYHELDPGQTGISNTGQKKWKVFMLYAMGAKPGANRALCPITTSLLDQVPHLFQAFFSILEAGKSVPAHSGVNLGQIRYHLGLIVPTDNPPTIRIKDQFHTWQEGTSILFDDSWDHEVVNRSSGDRVILLVDVMRSLPLPLHILNLIYSRVIVRALYATGVIKNLERFR